MLIKQIGYFIVCATLIFSTNAKATMPDTTFQIDRESHFSQFVNETLLPFWQQRVQTSNFINKQGLTIEYAYVVHPNATETIVVSPGRVEGYLKYQEMVYDIYQQGYSVFVIDHQGQGLSSRILSNPHKGYVEQFDHYVQDLHQWIEQEVKTKTDTSLLLLCHSMGGAIGLRYVQAHPTQFRKAVFSSPMLRLDSGPIPRPVAQLLVTSVNTVQQWFSESAYFLGGHDYDVTPFSENVLTSSKPRYDFFRDTYQKHPKLQLGSVTFNWIKESSEAIDKIYQDASKIKIPYLILQAGNEQVVDNAGQDEFCALEDNKNCEYGVPLVITDGQHELFIERDELRNKALNAIFAFFRN